MNEKAKELRNALAGTPGFAGWVRWTEHGRFEVGVFGECDLPANHEGRRVVAVMCEKAEEKPCAEAPPEEIEEEEAPEVTEADLSDDE